MATILNHRPLSLSLLKIQAHSQKWRLPSLSPSSSSLKLNCFSLSSSTEKPRKLILYSKPGCCLCDGLKEKLNAAFDSSTSLNNVELQVRDITTNSDWEKAYQYEIPVLAKLCDDGTEEILPRLSPRLGVELIQKKIADVFRQ
ncbi:uncharacterized protein LOC141586293 [Silene latifolia]|uniref:uncharacterized protein LOC141586293 n=1 Tax=Silene latifolia TaxID=37657 RepID=UPI003D7840F6